MWGSPPRVRGKLRHSDALRPSDRITPARAGKTHSGRAPGWAETDHPRACGENILTLVNPARISGSPPRVRGKRTSPRPTPACTRITPARAGKTNSHNFLVHQTQDHPRACGENILAYSHEYVNRGSPPRVRGKQILQRRLALLPRITPARAGKTHFAPLLLLLHRDHPRACGENYNAQIESYTQAGSPPRVRGKRPDFQPDSG